MMSLAATVRRNLGYYWRTNVAVVLGVAIAVSVLAGASVVGDSVRASLRDLFLNRIGNTNSVISGPGFFREKLSEPFGDACPLIVMEGLVIQESGGTRGSHVSVYGVDDRFWKFHNKGVQSLKPREALLSAGLAQELGVKAGDAVLVRVEKPSAIPAEWLHGRKDDAGQAMRLTTRQVLSPEEFGEFSLRPQQGAVRAIFVPLSRLQRDLDQPGKVNTILIGPAQTGSPSADRILRDSFALEDLGIKLRELEERRAISVESDSALIGDSIARVEISAATALGMNPLPLFTYLANSIRLGEREIPYSLVTAIDLAKIVSSGVSASSILLNDWAATDLGAKAGDTLTLEYYVWTNEGRLVTEKANFQLAAIVPIRGIAADRDLAPEYPGMTDSESLHDWDPPFPVDLARIRGRDEEYWKKYRTTPKAFIALEKGRQIWGSRFGKITSIRLSVPEGSDISAARAAYAKRLRQAIDPIAAGFVVFPVRAQGLEAAHGATDFGEYFLYFSFFLMASALVLTGLFFRLGVEQRLREIGTLRALGWSMTRIRNLFLCEGMVLAVAGSIVGILGAAGYAGLVLVGLRTLWVDAVGTNLLALHLSVPALLLGASAGIFTAIVCIALTLRGLRRLSPLGLLAGHAASHLRRPARVYKPLAVIAGAAAVALLGAASFHGIDQAAGFFGSGTLLLVSTLLFQWIWLSGNSGKVLRDVPRLGFRYATYRPGRSILCIALIAFAAFIIVAVDAFRHPAASVSGDRKSGDGGYSMLAESVLPVYYDPNTPAGKESLNLNAIGPMAKFSRFRLRPGDDASCLNLYQPRNPRILAPAGDFIRSARFQFQDSMARTAEEKNNPWLLLESSADGAVPAIADASTLEYALHLKLGDVFVLNPSTDHAVKLRLVGALKDSVFQSELLISETNFLRAFPGEGGYRFFLIDSSPENSMQASRIVEETLSDYGVDVMSTAARLAGFHRVENTYLSTFQTLGSLGLLLGTVGLAAVMLRNVLERRRELALLQAVGYRAKNLAVMVVAENVYLLFSGIAGGTFCALIAIAPVFARRGGHLPGFSIGLLLIGVVLTGLLTSLLAMRAVTRAPVLASLRSE